MLNGQVVAAFGRRFAVELADGQTVSCVTRGKKGGIACGDRVSIALTGPAQGVIEAVAPRATLLYRSDPFKEKIIAANVTQIVVVVAAVPSFYEELVNRCLAAAEAAGIRALIVLNKCDLAEETRAALDALRLYRELGYTVLPLSALQSIEPLRPWLKGQTSVLVGQSGMGKSSIINALLPDAGARTREISQTLDSGKHTTTHARLYHLDAASELIDCPGVQVFGLHHLTFADIEAGFPEFLPYRGQCRFYNCRHQHEPDCALRIAAETGTIDVRRFKLFQDISRSVGKQ